MNLPFDKVASHDVVEREMLKDLYKVIGALKSAEVRLKPILGEQLRLSIIDSAAVRALESQWRPILDQNPDMDQRYYGTWAEYFFVPECLDDVYLIDNIYNFEDPAAFNVAIWYGERLAGVGRGGYKKECSRGFLSVHLREGDPDPGHPLKGKIGPIIHETASAQARAFGVDKVFYIGPFSPGAIKVHEAMGFKKQVVETRGGERQSVYIGPVLPSEQLCVMASRGLHKQTP